MHFPSVICYHLALRHKYHLQYQIVIHPQYQSCICVET